ncbi:hypothetical protein AAVH_34963 [Aphelenchoides avenae]|nr:hypothetical protein AAVH_34963 [Aphelenchus avenae]
MNAVKGFENSSKINVTGKGGFSAVAAVKCGRQFVWYELGYRYFAAAGVSNENYAITSGSVDSYNANCGQIMFFP